MEGKYILSTLTDNFNCNIDWHKVTVFKISQTLMCGQNIRKCLGLHKPTILLQHTFDES